MERIWRVELGKGDFQELADRSNSIHSLLRTRDHGLPGMIFCSDNGVLISNEIQQFSGMCHIGTQGGHIPMTCSDTLQCLHALGHNKCSLLNSKSSRTDQRRNFTEAVTDKGVWL